MKNKVIKIVIIICLSFFIRNDVLAATCNWVKPKGIVTTGAVWSCPDSNTIISKSDSECSGTKPSADIMCCCPKPVATSVTEPKFKLPDYVFQIPIGKLVGLTTVDCSSGTCQIPFIAQYVTAVYTYGLSVAGILGVLVLMAAGLLWLVSGGDSSKITRAKQLIFGSATGLLLLVGLSLFLSFINPDLIKTKTIDLEYINRIEIEGDNNSPTVSMDTSSISSILGVNCGKDSVSQIVNKSKGKVTYSQEKRTKSTPEGYVYLDCSSFANFVLKCATGKNSGQRSADIFSEQKVWDQKLESLQPGDMVGWAPKNNAKNNGHVIIYMGNGLFGDCHSGSGKRPGNCVSNSMGLEKIKEYASSHSDGRIYLKRY